MTIATNPVHVVATLQARPEHVAALRSLLTELARASREQAGNTRFEVHQQSADPAQFITVERWDGAASADAHMTSPHVGAALGQLGALLAAPPQIVRYGQVA